MCETFLQSSTCPSPNNQTICCCLKFWGEMALLEDGLTLIQVWCCMIFETYKDLLRIYCTWIWLMALRFSSSSRDVQGIQVLCIVSRCNTDCLRMAAKCNKHQWTWMKTFLESWQSVTLLAWICDFFYWDCLSLNLSLSDWRHSACGFHTIVNVQFDICSVYMHYMLI